MQTVEYFLEPISALQQTGKDLTFSVEFDDIKKLRSADDPTLDQGDWVTDLKVANWPEVTKRCTELLKNTTKDLRLVTWMTEAMVHTRGLSGLTEGYTLFSGLCNRYWESMHPQSEDEEHEERVGTLAWLLAQSAVWVTRIEVVNDGQSKYTFADYAAARSRLGGTRHEDSSVVDLDRLDRARSATPLAFYEKLSQEAFSAMAALESLQACARTLLGEQAPSFSSALEAHQDVVDTIQRFAKDAGVTLDSGLAQPAPANAEVDAASADVIHPSTIASGAIASRAEALALLRQVAQYFREAEPHSPAAYLADQAAKWGAMTLHEWLPLVLRDDGSLSRLQELLGVPTLPQP